MRKYNHAEGNNPIEIMTFLEKYATQNFASEKEKADFIKELYAKSSDFLATRQLDVNEANIEANIEAIKAYERLKTTLIADFMPKIEDKKPCGCQDKHEPKQDKPCYHRPCFWAIVAGVILITALSTYAITDYFKDSK